jgi:hypothetical protein
MNALMVVSLDKNSTTRDPNEPTGGDGFSLGFGPTWFTCAAAELITLLQDNYVFQ